jgi:hypothetical protein
VEISARNRTANCSGVLCCPAPTIVPILLSQDGLDPNTLATGLADVFVSHANSSND